MLMLKGLIGAVLNLLLFGVLLLVPAGLVPGGTWCWPRGLVFLGIFGLVLVASTVALSLTAPASLQARLGWRASRRQPAADRVITALLVLSFLGWLAFIPLDVFYLELLPEPPAVLSACSGVLSLIALAVVMQAVRQNAFARPIVEDQTDRGQVLVDTGLYARVRHPFYLGHMLFVAGAALWLESYAALIATSGMLAIIVVRIAVEEKALRKALPGYVEYTGRVRHRLVPFVW